MFFNFFLFYVFFFFITMGREALNLAYSVESSSDMPLSHNDLAPFLEFKYQLVEVIEFIIHCNVKSIFYNQA